MLLLIVIGIIPCIVVGQGIISNYEKRAVSVRTAEIQNQSTIARKSSWKSGLFKGSTVRNIGCGAGTAC